MHVPYLLWMSMMVESHAVVTSRFVHLRKVVVHVMLLPIVQPCDVTTK